VYQNLLYTDGLKSMKAVITILYLLKMMLQYILWYNTERPHHGLNKSEFSQTGITYTTFGDIMV
jgi:hypothetical protein